MHRAAVVSVASLLLAACGGDSGSPVASEPPRTTNPLCAELRPREMGRVDTPAAIELSGLVASRTQPGVLWTHNDSGDGPGLLELDEDGKLDSEWQVPGAENVDWEDIAARGDTLYIADIGDNDQKRSSIVVYKMHESGEPAGRLEMRYEDGAHDAETLLVDPRDGSIFVVTKSYSGENRIYVERDGTLYPSRVVGLAAGEPATGGDVSADGKTVVLRSYDRVLVWNRRGGESLEKVFGREPCGAGADLSAEGQGEALALARDGRSFFTVAEGSRPPLRRYAPAR
jgi:hypothetical protein